MTVSADEQKLLDRLAPRRAAMIEDIARYVAIPTGYRHRAGLDELRGLVVDRLQALGAAIELRPGESAPGWLPNATDDEPLPTLVATRRGTGPRLMIAGHLDTVHDPAGSFRELSIAPDGNTATGPGAVDMKGGIVLALHALEVMAESGLDPDWTFVLNSDEETGSFESAEQLRAVARDHDFGVALEPALADGGLAIERMGAGQFVIETFGQSAHVGRAFTDGISAVTALAEQLLRVAAIADPANGRIVSIGPLEGGIATNVVPDHAIAWGNARFVDAAAGAAIAEALHALETQGDTLPRVRVHHLWHRPAKPRTPAVERLAGVAREAAEALGGSLSFAATGGVCDGNVMQSAGLATIDTLGIRGGNLHRPDEWIDLETMVERAGLLTLVLARLTAGHSGE